MKFFTRKIFRSETFVLTLVWVLMIILTNPFGDFPLNDDWSYGKAVFNLLESGELEFTGWTAMTLFSQVLWGALFSLPFGFSFTALRISVLVLGWLGVFISWKIFNELTDNRKLSLGAALLIAVNPLYFAMSNSFMTDVPFFTFAFLSFLFFIRLFRKEQWPSLIWAVIFSAWAVLTRQTGLLFPAVFMITYLIFKTRTFRSVLFATLPFLFSFFVLVLYVKWLEQAGKTPYEFGDFKELVHYLNKPAVIIIKLVLLCTSMIILYLGFFVWPFSFNVKMPVLQKISLLKYISIFLALLFWILILIFPPNGSLLMPVWNNVLDIHGIGPLTVRDTFILHQNYPAEVPQLIWQLISVLAVSGALFLLLFFIRWVVKLFQFRLLHSDRGTGFFILVSMLVYLIFISLSRNFIDRYFIFFLPMVLSFFLLYFKWVFRRVFLVVLALYLLFSVAITHDYLAWNRARWQGLDYLTEELKVSPRQIDGGFEFNGWHIYPEYFNFTIYRSWWWVVDDEYMVSFGDIEGFEKIKTISYRKYLPWGKDYIFVLKKLSAERQEE